MKFITENKIDLIISVVASLIATLIVWGLSEAMRIEPIRVPVWMAALIIFILIYLFFTNRVKNKLVIVNDKFFDTETVVIDNKIFNRCSFTNCKLIFSGDGESGFGNCVINSSLVIFEGPAKNAISLLSAFYRDQSLKPIADQYFNLMKKISN